MSAVDQIVAARKGSTLPCLAWPTAHDGELVLRTWLIMICFVHSDGTDEEVKALAAATCASTEIGAEILVCIDDARKRMQNYDATRMPSHNVRDTLASGALLTAVEVCDSAPVCCDGCLSVALQSPRVPSLP